MSFIINYFKNLFKEEENIAWKSGLFTKTLAVFISFGFLQNGFLAVSYHEMSFFMTSYFNYSETEALVINGLTTSIFNFGAIFGIVLLYNFNKHFGRPRTSMIIDYIMIAGSFLTMISNPGMIIVGRFTQGVAGGGNYLLTPIYLKEIAPKGKRGFIIGISSVAWAVGVTICYVSDMGLPTPDSDRKYADTSSTWWRFEYSIPIYFSFFRLLFINGVFDYETPIFLYNQEKKNRTVRAKTALEAIIKEDMIPDYMEEIVCETNECRNLHYPTYRELFGFAYIRATLLIMALTVFNALSGGYPIIDYVSGFIQRKDSGINDVTFARGLAAIGGLVLISSSLTTTLLTDYVGRRPLLLFGTFLVALSLLFVAVFFETGDFKTRLGFLYLFFFAFNFSYGSTFYTYYAEVLPNIGVAAVLVVNNFFSYGSQFLFPFLVSRLGEAELLFYLSGFSFVGFTYIYFLIPEVKRKTFSQVFHAFHGDWLHGKLVHKLFIYLRNEWEEISRKKREASILRENTYTNGLTEGDKSENKSLELESKVDTISKKLTN